MGAREARHRLLRDDLSLRDFAFDARMRQWPAARVLYAGLTFRLPLRHKSPLETYLRLGVGGKGPCECVHCAARRSGISPTPTSETARAAGRRFAAPPARTQGVSAVLHRIAFVLGLVALAGAAAAEPSRRPLPEPTFKSLVPIAGAAGGLVPPRAQ